MTKLMLVTIWCVKFSPPTFMVNILHFHQELLGQKAKTMLETEFVGDRFEMLVTILATIDEPPTSSRQNQNSDKKDFLSTGIPFVKSKVK